MIGRLAVSACVVALAGCAGMEPAGRSASRGPSVSPPPVEAAPAPPPIATPPEAPIPPPAPAAPTPSDSAPSAPPPPPREIGSARPEAAPTRASPQPTGPQAIPAPAPDINAPPVAAPETAPQRITTRPSDDEVVVPGGVERQVPAPQGDPRSRMERMEDVRAWDQCVTQVQAAYERNPMRPQLDSPEEYCGRSLGMSSRTAVPESRLERRR